MAGWNRVSTFLKKLRVQHRQTGSASDSDQSAWVDCSPASACWLINSRDSTDCWTHKATSQLHAGCSVCWGVLPEQ